MGNFSINAISSQNTYYNSKIAMPSRAHNFIIAWCEEGIYVDGVMISCE